MYAYNKTVLPVGIRQGKNGKEIMAMKAALHNLGCKVNEYELEQMALRLAGAGYEIVPFAPGADVYIINTCTVTNIADKKSRQMLHRAKSMNPDAVVAAVGCYVDVRKDELAADPLIDICLTNAQKQNIAEALAAFFGRKDDAAVPGETREECGRGFVSGRSGDRTRAFIKIEDGCDRFCSYCIIPYARGRVRVRDAEDVLDELRVRAGEGYKEIVLTGIQVGAYGAGPLSDLITAAAQIPGIERIRLGSLEPQLITETFLARIRDTEEFCPQFHLSLQSGCDETLRRMNRHYTTKEYADICGMIREIWPDAAITTDLIVGFPGETEEEFARTCAFLKETSFARVHIFRYARRKGTAADRMKEQVPERVKILRSKEAEQITKETARQYVQRMDGSVRDVLFEEKKKLGAKEMWTGYTKEYVQVFMASEEDLSNRILPCVLRAGEDGIVYGQT